jgi:hypothetical protein
MKSGLGVGEKQCWNKRPAVLSVQWSVWVYAVLVWDGYRTWGLCAGPAPPAPWWPGAKRWSFNTLWRSYRAVLWGTPEFRPLWLGTGDNGYKKEIWLAGLANSIAASVRIEYKKGAPGTLFVLISLLNFAQRAKVQGRLISK